MHRSIALVAAALTLSCPLLPQCPSGQSYPMDHFIAASVAGAETGRLLLEGDRIAAETEAIRAQTERLRRRSGLRMSDIVSDPVAWGRFEALMIQRFPDFNGYRVQMARLTTLFEQGDASLAEYVEGLYVMAKHASFSKTTHP